MNLINIRTCNFHAIIHYEFHLISSKKKFKNTYNFCNGDIDKFMLLLRKGIYPYKYMDDWSRFDEEQ